MNRRRFDDWTRLIISTTSRRRPLLALASAIVAAPTLRLRPGRAAGCRKAGRPCERTTACCRNARCRAGKCKCKAGLSRIAGRYALPSADPRCSSTCNSGYNLFDGSLVVCVEPAGGCAGMGAECANHAECGQEALCTATACDPGYRCQTLCEV
jgi:hypothetical protein